ncbi:MFS transporter [Breoghania corrubedonensis]|uniref:MFS transporter n=1 Tax=Breoghania corrubedonensis TaxID=665038 RepID=A0A2T5V7X8_9HYPH|nr:MFS transporter [Breoghania corrubedonensis]PTW59867.1 MFS transporter [Breoghania corrubedonensis]
MEVTSGLVGVNPNVASGGGHAVRPGDIATGVIIGRTSEFFDFFVYAIASVVVFPRLVFPFVDALTGTLYSFAIFALAFIARPIGSALFMALDRAHGRGVKLTVALLLLGTSTVCLAFLPGYGQIGAASIMILAILRIGQGVALGGSWDGLASLLSLSAPAGKRGWYAMVPQLGAPLGLMVASGLFAYLVSQLSADDFFSWGWRYPFFVAFALNVVALFARLRIVDTDEFRRLFQSRDLQPTPVISTVRAQGRAIVIGAFAPLASFALFHMVTVYPLSWVFLVSGHETAEFLMIEVVAAMVGLVTIVLSGWIADRIGRRRLLAWCAVAIALFSGLAPVLLDQVGTGDVVFMLVGFALLGLTFGQCSGAVASSFPNEYRYTGSALTSDLAWMFGAGFAPFAALYLSSTFGIAMAGLYLLSGAACTLIALALNRKLADS